MKHFAPQFEFNLNKRTFDIGLGSEGGVRNIKTIAAATLEEAVEKYKQSLKGRKLPRGEIRNI